MQVHSSLEQARTARKRDESRVPGLYFKKIEKTYHTRLDRKVLTPTHVMETMYYLLKRSVKVP